MEIWDAYFADGTLAGIDLVRGEAIPDGLFHAVAEVFVCHEDGACLVMQRDWSKPNFPGMFESGAGGSVCKGETFLAGALRELEEETGIHAKRLQELTTIVDHERRTIYREYLCVCAIEKESIVLQKGETIAYRWLPPDDFRAFLYDKTFVPVLRSHIEPFLEQILQEKTA